MGDSVTVSFGRDVAFATGFPVAFVFNVFKGNGFFVWDDS